MDSSLLAGRPPPSAVDLAIEGLQQQFEQLQWRICVNCNYLHEQQVDMRRDMNELKASLLHEGVVGDGLAAGGDAPAMEQRPPPTALPAPPPVPVPPAPPTVPQQLHASSGSLALAPVWRAAQPAARCSNGTAAAAPPREAAGARRGADVGAVAAVVRDEEPACEDGQVALLDAVALALAAEKVIAEDQEEETVGPIGGTSGDAQPVLAALPPPRADATGGGDRKALLQPPGGRNDVPRKVSVLFGDRGDRPGATRSTATTLPGSGVNSVEPTLPDPFVDLSSALSPAASCTNNEAGIFSSQPLSMWSDELGGEALRRPRGLFGDGNAGTTDTLSRRIDAMEVEMGSNQSQLRAEIRKDIARLRREVFKVLADSSDDSDKDIELTKPRKKVWEVNGFGTASTGVKDGESEDALDCETRSRHTSRSSLTSTAKGLFGDAAPHVSFHSAATSRSVTSKRSRASRLSTKAVNRSNLGETLSKRAAVFYQNSIAGNSDHTVAVPSKHMTQVAVENTYYYFNDTVWDASLFIGLNSVGISESLTLFCAAVLSMLLQASFCFVLAVRFVEDVDDSVDNARRWRQLHGHAFAYMDPVTRSSLVNRVCNEDSFLPVGFGQQEMRMEYEEYTSKVFGFVPSGPAFTLLALVCWWTRVAVEMLSAFRFLSAVRHVPRGRDTQLMMTPSGRTFKLKQISLGRSWIGIAIAALRIAIVLPLLLWGSRWLIYTTDIRETIVNSTALSFILDIDELLYQVLCTETSRGLVTNMRPLRLPSSTFRGRIVELQRGVILLILAAFGICLLLMELLPMYRIIEDVLEEMCGGDQSFFLSHPVEGPPVYFSEPPRSEEFVDTRREVVQRLVGTEAMGATAELVLLNASGYLEHLSSSALHVAEAAGTCRQMMEASLLGCPV